MSSTAVIPGYNEVDTIESVIRDVKKYVNQIIYVDDGSTDGTASEAKSIDNEIRVIKVKENRGKGFAMRQGFKKAMDLDYDKVVTIDSDGQHRAKNIPKMLDLLDEYDMVIGNRYGRRHYTVPRNVMGNFGLNFLTNLFSYGPQGFLRNEWVEDTQSGLRAINVEALKKMNLISNEYQIESEMIYEAAKHGLKIEEIPVFVPIRVEGTQIMDGINNFLMVFKKRFNL